MECITITPSQLKGSIQVPPSKSIAHRAVICGGLSAGQSVINNIDYSDDINATINGMEKIGSIFKRMEKGLLADGTGFLGERKDNLTSIIDCCESGTTLRMLVPLALAKENSVNFTGRGNLGKRPLTPYYDIFDNQNIKYEYEKEKLNLNVHGSLKPGRYSIRGDISSQFISGLLMALPLLNGDSTIEITTELESKGYVDLTIEMLNKFGIFIGNFDYKRFEIKGNQQYKPRRVDIEGDFSQAAFFLCADALGSEIECRGLNDSSLQGDRAILNVLKAMGSCIEVNQGYIKASGSGTYGTIIDGSQIPDILPPLAAAASLSCGTTKIINAGRLRVKECDRLKAMHDELSKLGADIKELDDGLVINGRECLEGGTVEGWNDHRVVMALAIASTRCKNPVTIKGSAAVKKSYPGFWDDFKSLGGNIHGWNMG